MESIYFAKLQWLNYFYLSTKQLFVSMCITAGKLTRELPYQHRADTHSYYHLCSQASQEPEEESLGCSFGHSTGVFWNQHGTEEITGTHIHYVYRLVKLCLWYIVLHIVGMFLCCVTQIYLSTPDRRRLLRQQGRRVKHPWWSWTWETCWQL